MSVGLSEAPAARGLKAPQDVEQHTPQRSSRRFAERHADPDLARPTLAAHPYRTCAELGYDLSLPWMAGLRGSVLVGPTEPERVSWQVRTRATAS
jgi:hypothetical protein